MEEAIEEVADEEAAVEDPAALDDPDPAAAARVQISLVML